MSSKGAAPTQVYEDFVPSSKLDKEEHIDTIHLNLQGDFILVILVIDYLFSSSSQGGS